MLAKLAEYSLVVILLAVMVEELGIPMPIPTDVLIVFIGAVAATSVLQLGQFFIMLSVVSAIGASGLYAIVRHSGRPLVERFGRYVHLGPKQLARSEALLARGGWKAIALGRATPGLRYPTVIACGLFRISYPRFYWGVSPEPLRSPPPGL
jgi:membrane protein DedA with SNARE-associated domain